MSDGTASRMTDGQTDDNPISTNQYMTSLVCVLTFDIKSLTVAAAIRQKDD